MAVVVNSDASAFKRTANLPSATNFSIWGWFYFGVDRNDYSGFMTLKASDDNYIEMTTDVDGTDLKLWRASGGTNSDVSLATLVAGNWYFGAITCSGTGSNGITGYLRQLGTNTLTAVNLTLGTSYTPASAEWGRDGYTGFYLNGRIHACGMADTVLSADQLLQISMYHEPHRLGIPSINVFYPTIESVNTNATIDRSGNGRNATATVGALADAPPLLWMPRRNQIVVPSGATVVTGSGSVLLDALAVAGAGAIERKGAGAILLEVVEVAGAGTRIVTGNGAITLGALEVAGSGDVSNEVTGSGAIGLSALIVDGAGAVERKGNGAIDLDPLTVAGTGAVERKGSGDISLDPLEVSGSGSVFSGVAGAGTILLDELQVAGVGEVEHEGGGNIVLGLLEVAGAGAIERKGSGAIVLAALEVSGYDTPPIPAIGQYKDGTAFDAYGRMVTRYIAPDVFPPSDTRWIAGLAHDGNAARYITTWPGSPGYIEGFAVSVNGVQVVAADEAPFGAIGGIPVTYRGEVCVAENYPVQAVEGLGLDTGGLLCVSDKG